MQQRLLSEGANLSLQKVMDISLSLEYVIKQAAVIHNQFHNILRLFNVLPNFPLTTSETMSDYYL